RAMQPTDAALKTRSMTSTVRDRLASRVPDSGLLHPPDAIAPRADGGVSGPPSLRPKVAKNRAKEAPVLPATTARLPSAHPGHAAHRTPANPRAPGSSRSREPSRRGRVMMARKA